MGPQSSPEESTHESELQAVTRLLRRLSGGDREAFDHLIPLVYDQLRRLASRSLRVGRRDHTLRATRASRGSGPRDCGQSGLRRKVDRSVTDPRGDWRWWHAQDLPCVPRRPGLRAEGRHKVDARRFWRRPHSAPEFRLERHILAKLNHPNLARLLDGGVSAEGLPYLVMEYVGRRADRHLLPREAAFD
jgi:serine/threonine protein kinase